MQRAPLIEDTEIQSAFYSRMVMRGTAGDVCQYPGPPYRKRTSCSHGDPLQIEQRLVSTP